MTRGIRRTILTINRAIMTSASAASVSTDMLHFETQLWNEGFSRVMGLDEAGRGCLCGPVVAAGVILKPGHGLEVEGVRDSKTLTERRRQELAARIRDEALFWVVRESSVEEIDRWNILQASLLAMRRCAEEATATPDYLLIDGNRFHAGLVPHQCVVKGDARSLSIAAASILAKVHRDALLMDLDARHPQYGWARNKGYATRDHYEAIREHGITPHHRRSFRLE
jgi:ribonuclease HII